MDLEHYAIRMESIKGLLKSFTSLTDKQIDILELACFNMAITTVRANSEVTIELMEAAYEDIYLGKKTYNEILDNLNFLTRLRL